MKQKIHDIFVFIRESRKGKVILVLILLAGAFLIFSDNSDKRSTKQAKVKKETLSAGAPSTKEGTDDVIRSLVGEFTELKSAIRQSESRREELEDKMNKNEQRVAEIIKKMLEQMATVQASGGGQAPYDPYFPTNATDPRNAIIPDQTGNIQQPVTDASIPEPFEPENPPVGELEQFGQVTQAEVSPPRVLSDLERPVAFVGIGDSVKVKLLAGVNASTDGTPYPVLFELVGPVNGPNKQKLPLGQARIMAAAQGSLSDSRALFRLTDSDMAMPNGKRKVIKVDGWVVGEDGMKGLQGVLIDPLGKAVAAAGLAGLISGLGEGISEANSTTQLFNNGNSRTFVDGNVGEYAAGQAGSSAARIWERMIRDRQKKMVPLVQVLAGREATAIFSESFAIKGLFEALEDDNQSGDIYP